MEVEDFALIACNEPRAGAEHQGRGDVESHQLRGDLEVSERWANQSSITQKGHVNLRTPYQPQLQDPLNFSLNLDNPANQPVFVSPKRTAPNKTFL